MRFVALCCTLLALGAALTVPKFVVAAECCDHCGCSAECRSVCHLVCIEKKVELICWGCKAEDFCVPGPSVGGCTHCEEVCPSSECGCKGCCRPHRFVWREWTPCSATTFTKKKLMKKVVVRKIPSHKWVTENLCEACAADCSGPLAEPTQAAEPAPVAEPAGKPSPVAPRGKPTKK